ncbi:MAG: S8 family serine peptidase [Clostridia bacterium]|nr:S8 family serine peptidase [Clostridia bacterium]
MKKLLCILLALFMVAAIAPVSMAENVRVADDPVNPNALRVSEEAEKPAADPNEIVTVVVKLKDKPVAARVDDVHSEMANDIASILRTRQTAVEKAVLDLLDKGDTMRITYEYTLLFNGFAAEMPRYMIEKIARLEGVEKAFEAPRWNAPEAFEGEDDRLSSSVGFINGDDAWSAGYTGKGTTIAVIDTGAVVGHRAFSTAPANPKMTSSSIGTVLANNNMHCEQQYSGTLSASNLYYSAKIPFRFDYAGSDTDVSHADAGSDHGSHVAGIACGYYSGSSYTGVAKDAQLIVMKVFGSSGGAGWDVIAAALEDCVYLDVDAVNMSLGSGCGYTSDDPEMDELFDLLCQHGCNIACAAGNDGSSNGTQYYGSSYKTYALAMNPDNGIVGSPGTYSDSLCVACCQKSSASMVYFSSHGSTADLRIKPEVSAPGYNIYSATDSGLSGSTTGYGTKSGTSMSCPHVAGAQALLTNYVSATWPNLTGRDKIAMVNRLLMCTANPVSATSPRTQGAGIIDLQKAITTKAYITVDGCERPKLEIGDDPNKTGVYTLSFNIVNFSSTALSYTMNTTVLTENTGTATVNSQSVVTLSGSNRNITSSATISGDTSVTVPANSTKNVTLTVTLNSSIKSDLDSKFPNGIYIDGFVVCDGTVDLVVPFLGFYGNWNRASVFDRYTYIDEIQGINHYNIHSYQAEVGAVTSGSSYMLFGANPYVTSSDWLADRCTLSPNGDTYYERIDKLTYDLIRNAGEGGIRIYNEDTGETYVDVDLSYMPKAWNYPNGNSSSAFYHSSDNIGDLFTSWAPTGLAEGTHIVFKLYHYLDNPGFTPDQNECAEIVLPMTVDNTAPEVTYWKVENGTLTVRVHDEHYAAWIGVYSNAACTTKITEQAICETSRGADSDLTLNIGNYSTVYVKVGDYGHNTSSVYTLTGEGGSIDPVDLVSMTLTPENAEVVVGNSATLTVNKVPQNANNYEIAWTSSNANVATVTGSKNSASVLGVAAGTAVITATATDPDTGAVVATATANVTVSEFEGYILTSELEVGGQYIICSGSQAVGNTIYSSNHYLTAHGVTVNSDNTVTVPASLDANTILWEIESGTASAGFTFKNLGNGKYMGLDSSEYLYPSATPVAWLYQNGDLNNQIDSEGYYYLALSSNSNYFTTSKNTNGLIRFYKWVSASEPEPVYYTVTFVDWDGAVLKTESVPEGGAATAPSDPSRVGYTFTGWDVDFSNVTSDLTVTAQYTINTYTVTFRDWDGTVLKVQTVEYGGDATPPADPVREGYTFTGWSGDYTNVTFDKNITAMYEINRYTVTFVDWNGAVLKTETVVYGGFATAPDDPVREGYTFIGWDVDFSVVTSDLTVTALYEENGPSVTLLGDVDLDGEVTAADALLAMRHAMSITTITGQGFVNGDMDGDGQLTASDAVLIMRLVMNIVS